jgi:hypothetical protein
MNNTIEISKEKFKSLYDIACPTWQTKFQDMFKNQLFKEKLEFNRNFVQEMESACTKEQLPVFKEIFGKFLGDDLFSKIKTYIDVCKELGEKPAKSPYDKIKQIEKLFCGNWKKDFSNNNQRKWYPYFVWNNSGGLVFDGSLCDHSFFFGRVAYFPDEKTSNFVGRTFIDIYRELSR